MIIIHLSPKAIVRFILPSIYIKVRGKTICSTGWESHDWTSTYIPATVRSWCKCFMWIWVLGIGTLLAFLPSVREVPPTIRGVPYPAATPPFGVNCKCLGDDALLHASRELMVYGNWNKPYPTFHPVIAWWRFYACVYPAPALLWTLPQNRGRRAAPLQVSYLSIFKVEWSYGLAALLLRLHHDHSDSWLLECCCRPWWVWWWVAGFPRPRYYSR